MNGPATYNRHWKPNWLICNPCRFHYDYIVKMESFSRDSGAVLRQVLSDKKTVVRHINGCSVQIGASELADINHLNGRGKSDRPPLDYERLLKNVPAHILAKILEIFHLDFVLFGYDKSLLVKLAEQKKRDLESKNNISLPKLPLNEWNQSCEILWFLFHYMTWPDSFLSSNIKTTLTVVPVKQRRTQWLYLELGCWSWWPIISYIEDMPRAKSRNISVLWAPNIFLLFFLHPGYICHL